MNAGETTSDECDSPVLPAGAIGGRAAFVTTHWSVVLTAGQHDATRALNALEQLCQMYWLPLYAYVRRRGYSPEDAKDLTQEFFARLLERDWVARADQQRGRFRTFLLTSMSHFLANEWEKARAQKRGGGRVVSLSCDAAEARCAWEPVDNFTPEQNFERRWVLTLLDRVMDRLSAEYARAGNGELYENLKPCLLGDRTAQPYAALAVKTGMTEGSIKVAVFRLRQRYRELLRDEIANTVETPEEIEEEMRYLFAVLARR